MSKQIKLELCLLSMDRNQLITAEVFFHWLRSYLFAMLLLMRSRICLLTLPISDFVGLISRHVGLFAKFGLWSLSVINASLSAVGIIYVFHYIFLSSGEREKRKDQLLDLQKSKQERTDSELQNLRQVSIWRSIWLIPILLAAPLAKIKRQRDKVVEKRAKSC